MRGLCGGCEQQGWLAGNHQVFHWLLQRGAPDTQLPESDLQYGGHTAATLLKQLWGHDFTVTSQRMRRVSAHPLHWTLHTEQEKVSSEFSAQDLEILSRNDDRRGWHDWTGRTGRR